ncbi:MAG: hypothetical protein BGO09_15380 [Bacteroidetes bacterium 47-18]|nr:MAG: hypothetical protein BGO09_15380 [Bacteroidetes bacterium 47-18]
MKIYGIVAASENNVVGVGQNIPWHLPDDFKYFKAITLDHYILMGKNTWLTFVKPLPRRKHIVVSKTLQPSDLSKDVRLFSDISEAIRELEAENVPELFIIGGGKIYEQTFDLMDRVYITRVHTTIDNGTAFFPKINPKHWTLIESEPHTKDAKHQYDYTFEVWERKQQ